MASLENHLTTSLTYTPYVNLPRFFLDLTKLKNTDQQNFNYQVYQIVNFHPELKYIIHQMHQVELESNKSSIQEIIKKYHFNYFLDLIISSFLEKKFNGTYLHQIDITLALKLENICQQIRPHGLSSNSRILLLLTYLTLGEQKLFPKKKPQEDNNSFLQAILPYVNFINTNINEVDWMLLALSNLHQVIGEQKLTSYLTSGKTLTQIFSTLSPSDHKSILINLINYATSIEEEHLFYQEFI